MTGVLIKRGHLDREGHAQSDNDMKTVIYQSRDTRLQSEEQAEMSPSEGGRPCGHLDFGLPASRT